MRPVRLPGVSPGLLVLAGGLLLGCSRPAPEPRADHDAGPAWFADVPHPPGPDFVPHAGPPGPSFIPPATACAPRSGGAAPPRPPRAAPARPPPPPAHPPAPAAPPPTRLYRQGADGRFTDVSKGSGLDVAGYCTGVAVGDVNNDGRPDVLVT